MRNHEIFVEMDPLGFLLLKIKKEGNYRGYRSQLAKAAGCQPAYLSQVLAKKVLMTVDQAAGLSDFWGLNELESDYFLTLVELSRAGSESLRIKLKKRLARLQEKHQSQGLSDQDMISPQATNLSGAQAVQYYSSWLPSAVHMLLTIKKTATVKDLADQLQIKQEIVQSALMILVNARVVEKLGENYLLITKFIHVDDDIVYANMHHKNWRDKVKEYFSQRLESNSYHYTSICSLDKKAFQEVRKILDQAKCNSEDVIINSKESVLGCMILDWFEV